MVAMGSSLADGAWDRETAVYRISGVMAVISGWFLTAFTAFIAAGIAVLLCIWFGPIFMVIGGVCVVALLIRSNFFSKDKKVEAMEDFEAGLSKEELRKRFNAAIDRNLKQTIDIFSNTTMNFLSEDYSAVKKDKLEAQELLDHISLLRSQYYLMISHGQGAGKDYDARNYYYRTFSNVKDVAQDLRNTVNQMEQHLANSHSVFKGQLRANLLKAVDALSNFQKSLSEYVMNGSTTDEVLLRLSNTNLEEVNAFQLELMKEIEVNKMPLHRSELYLSILQLYREIINRYTVIVLLQRELNFMLSEKQEDEHAAEAPAEPQH